MNDILTKMCGAGLVAADSAAEVRRLQQAGTPLDEALREAGLPEDEVLRFLAREFDIPYADLEADPPSREVVSRFPARLLLKHGLLPVREDDGCVTVATSRLSDTTGLDELRLVTGRNLRPAAATSEEINRCLRSFLGVGADTVQSLVSEADGDNVQVIDVDTDGTVDLAAAAEDASIIRLVNQVLTEAIDLRATDVHFEPFEDQLRVRYRVDGILQEAVIPPEVRRFQAAIVSRLKIMSRLDIAEKRLPQDGRIRLKAGGHDVDVRASVIPMLHGEAVVLRLLDRSGALLGLESLGMSDEDCRQFERILQVPHGIMLVTGPTGSGKTTTLYAGLSRINDIDRKIITIEDPVEYHLRGINQIQVSTKAGLTFALGLRSILRHDPDVVLVGEIRDLETAEIAVQASLTGHLVFSTLHTNDAPGALTRLVDMGVEPYLVASSLEAVLAQRLVRCICPECKDECSRAEWEKLRQMVGDEIPQRVFIGRGCRECLRTGYRGRQGVFELMHVTDEMREMILRNVSSRQIRRLAIEQGMKSLRQDGWRHVAAGRTSVQEVVRVTRDERGNGSLPV